MVRLNKTCWACNTKFSHCPSCSRADALKPSWASEFCSESCKDFWNTLTKYGMSMISKSEAKAIILNLDLKPIDVYASCVQRDYAKVMASDKKSRKISKKAEPAVEVEFIEQPKEVVEPVVETDMVDTVAIEPKSHEVVIEKENE